MKRKFDSMIRKAGNSHIITIPNSIIKRYSLEQGDYIDTEIEFDRKVTK